MSGGKRVALIGGGLVGLASAYAISKRWPDARIEVLEKEDRVAAHQSGRNSGVIHSGIYYTPGSMKAVMCREGRSQLVSFCRDHHVSFETCGKVIVAASEEEIPRLDAIFRRGQENGIRCTTLSPDELSEIEPYARGVKAIHVPDAGIADFSAVARCLKEILLETGHQVTTGAPVTALKQLEDRVLVTTDGSSRSYDLLINCAGLHSDRVAKMAGADPGLQIVPFRGVYFELKEQARKLCRNLIYPVPDPAYPFLGVHFTRTIDGRIEVGPNAVLATGREGYSLSQFSARDLLEAVRFRGFRKMALNHWRKGVVEVRRTVSKRAYVRALQTMVPAIKVDDLIPCRSGIRAQALRGDGSMVDDFVFIEQPNILHVCNAPSPAATACLAIGEAIANRVAGRM